jgi:hypothetical protein
MPRYNVHHGLSIHDEDDEEEDEHTGDENASPTQFVLHSPSPPNLPQRRVPVPISNRRRTTSTTPSVSDAPSTVSYDRTDPFLYLFNIAANPYFPLDALTADEHCVYFQVFRLTKLKYILKMITS